MVEEPCSHAGPEVPHCLVELPLGNDAESMAEAVRSICFTALVAWADFGSDDVNVTSLHCVLLLRQLFSMLPYIITASLSAVIIKT